MLNTNIKKYSSITLIDRQNLEQVLAEQGLSVSGNYSDEDYISIGKLTNAQYIMASLIQKIPGDEYSLQFSITDAATGVRAASFMKNGTSAQVRNGALINEASVDLLSQIGVRLTDSGRAALLRGRSAAVWAETGFAKGIAAEQSGDAVEAMLNYTQSIAFDPSQLEALDRLSNISREISGGTLSERILGDIEARKKWLDVLKRTASFFERRPPFEIAFDPSLIQEGQTDYERERVNLAMRMALNPSASSFDALNALLSGLEETGMRETWGFKGWPLAELNPRTQGVVMFKGRRSMSFKVIVSLLNDSGKTIAEGVLTLESGPIDFSNGNRMIAMPQGDAGLVRFSNVNANDLSPTLTIMIKSVNGISGNELGSTGYISIVTSDDLEETIEEKERARQAVKWEKERERLAKIDLDAGIEFVSGFGVDVGSHPLRYATLGIPGQLGVGFNFFNIRLTLFGEFGLYLLLLAKYGIAGELYLPGMNIGLEAAYGYGYDIIAGLAKLEEWHEPNYLRLGLNFFTDDVKWLVYASHLGYNDVFNMDDKKWALGLMLIAYGRSPL
jgi:hypothetical protein